MKLTRVDPTSCTTTTPGEDASAWQLIAADSFTFCLPKQWKVEPNKATLGSATLIWGGRELTKVPFQTGTVRIAGDGYGQTRMRSDEPPLSMTSGSPKRESIGGHDAMVSKLRFEKRYYVAAEWETPHVSFHGISTDEHDADFELAIIRSVRFPVR